MKKLLLAIATTGILLPSCKKSSSSTPAPSSSIPANGWKLGTTSYTTALSARLAAINELSAFDGIPSGSSPAVNSLNAYFSVLPTAAGTYHIVGYPAPSLGANDLGLSAGLYATSATYVSTGTDGINATVTVTGGKIKIVIPAVWVKNTTAGDSLKLTGTLIEQ